MIGIGVRSSYKSGDLRRLVPALEKPQRKRLFSLLGMALKKKARANAREHSHGGQFWPSIADSVGYRSDTDGVIVGAMHEAAAQKQLGGTIEAPGKGPGAKGAKALTIPIDDRAKGLSAGELNSRWRLFRLPGTNVLAANIDGQTVGMYALVKSVTQKPEPWFPDEGDVNRSISKAIRQSMR